MQAIDEPKVHVHDLHPNGRPGNVGPGGSNRLASSNTIGSPSA